MDYYQSAIVLNRLYEMSIAIEKSSTFHGRSAVETGKTARIDRMTDFMLLHYI